MALPTTLKNRLLSNLWRITPRAASLQPQSTSTAYFNVTGGRVIVVNIIGEVTVVMGVGNLNWLSNPTTHATLAMCSAVACTGDLVGQLYSLPSAVGGALNVDTTVCELGYLGMICHIGDLELNASASVVGETKWDCIWLPFDEGAAVNAT